MNKEELLKDLMELYHRVETDLMRMKAKKSPDGLIEMRNLMQEELKNIKEKRTKEALGKEIARKAHLLFKKHEAEHSLGCDCEGCGLLSPF